MSHNTQIIINQAQHNPELAMEIYCELYIYTHYTQDQVGLDVQAYTYQYQANESDTTNSWLGNLIYRLSSIFRRRGVHVTIDTNDIKDLIQHHSELGVSLA